MCLLSLHLRDILCWASFACWTAKIRQSPIISQTRYYITAQIHAALITISLTLLASDANVAHLKMTGCRKAIKAQRTLIALYNNVSAATPCHTTFSCKKLQCRV